MQRRPISVPGLRPQRDAPATRPRRVSYGHSPRGPPTSAAGRLSANRAINLRAARRKGFAGVAHALHGATPLRPVFMNRVCSKGVSLLPYPHHGRCGSTPHQHLHTQHPVVPSPMPHRIRSKGSQRNKILRLQNVWPCHALFWGYGPPVRPYSTQAQRLHQRNMRALEDGQMCSLAQQHVTAR